MVTIILHIYSSAGPFSLCNMHMSIWSNASEWSIYFSIDNALWRIMAHIEMMHNFSPIHKYKTLKQPFTNIIKFSSRTSLSSFREYKLSPSSWYVKFYKETTLDWVFAHTSIRSHIWYGRIFVDLSKSIGCNIVYNSVKSTIFSFTKTYKSICV